MRKVTVNRALIPLLALFLWSGCAAPGGGLDCKSDSGCIMQALRNGCQDAHMEVVGAKSSYTLGTADLRVSVANRGTSCKAEAVWTDASNNTLSSVGAEFRLPLESCKSAIPDSYVSVDGKCEGFSVR